MILAVDKYLKEGCMRCKYGGTPKCKVHNWIAELRILRNLVLETGLNEEIKWNIPVYTYKGKNIVSVNALKESANISFFKGVLLADEMKILQQQGNVQTGRIIRFKNAYEIELVKDILRSYIFEAITIEESGKKFDLKKDLEPIPEELLHIFETDPIFEKAFFSLTKGRQRGYIIHFSQPKHTITRIGRIEKYKEQILNGIGFHDKFKS